MLHYRLYGLHLASTIDFPQLIKEDKESEEADILIEAGNIHDRVTAKVTTKNWEFGDSLSWFINGTAWFEIISGNRIIYQIKPKANEQYLRSYLLGIAMAMLFMQRGKLAVHCSAVRNESGALLIAGESGSGKSTLTTDLLKDGYTLIADDMVIVDKAFEGGVMAYPAFPYQKLCRDAVIREGYDLDTLLYINETKDKFFVPYQDKFSISPVPVKAMVILAAYDGESVESIGVNGIEKVKMIYKNLFLRNFYANDIVNPHIFQQCLEVAAGIDMRIVLRPQKGDTFEQVKETVMTSMVK